MMTRVLFIITLLSPCYCVLVGVWFETHVANATMYINTVASEQAIHNHLTSQSWRRRSSWGDAQTKIRMPREVSSPYTVAIGSCHSTCNDGKGKNKLEMFNVKKADPSDPILSLWL